MGGTQQTARTSSYVIKDIKDFIAKHDKVPTEKTGIGRTRLESVVEDDRVGMEPELEESVAFGKRAQG